MKYLQIVRFSVLGAGLILLASCQQPGGNTTGSEYIPDMAHSVAYESNTYDYYYYNRWGSKEEYLQFANPRLPVKGTVPRGQGGSELLQQSNDGLNSSYGISIPVNGSVPYHYANTEEDRALAIAEILKNPLPISTAGIAKGKALYDIYCAICHGPNGDGAGYLVRDGGKYPVQPANFLLPEHVEASNGRFYHAIMHGRNLMGPYADKLSYNERWEVIHYIRSLQAKEVKLAYSETENTFNAYDTPNASISVGTKVVIDTVATDTTSPHEEPLPGNEQDHGGH